MLENMPDKISEDMSDKILENIDFMVGMIRNTIIFHKIFHYIIGIIFILI